MFRIVTVGPGSSNIFDLGWLNPVRSGDGSRQPDESSLHGVEVDIASGFLGPTAFRLGKKQLQTGLNLGDFRSLGCLGLGDFRSLGWLGLGDFRSLGWKEMLCVVDFFLRIEC